MVASSRAALADAFEAYLMADAGHRRVPAELLLSVPGAREFVLAKLAAFPVEERETRNGLWRLAVFDAVGKLAAENHQWIDTAVVWLEGGGATWQESASVCAEVGFQAYLADKPDPITIETFAALDARSVGGRAKVHLHLVALRLAYRWEAIESFLAELAVPISELDPYTQVYHVYSLLAGDHPDAQREMERLLKIAGDDYRINLSVVEGLRLSNAFPDQAQRMLDLLTRPPLATSQSPDPLYRKAYALRKLGRLGEALEVADECLQKIPPHQIQDRIRILQERDLILAELAITQQAEAARAAVQEQIRKAVAAMEENAAAQMAEIRRATTEGLFRTVEILGVFTAIITVLGGSIASIVARGLIWWQRGLLIVVAGAVAVAFFITLRLIVEPGESRRTRRSKQ